MSESFETTQNFCPQCGKATDADARFCKHCAYDLSNVGVNQDVSAENSQSHSRRTIIGIIGVLCLLIFGIIGVAIKITGEKAGQQSAENVNSVSQAPDSALTLGEKARQIEEKILRGEALNADDLAGLSPQELRILRNVHFARYGRKYERPGLGDYFFARSWYKPKDDYRDSMITMTDKDNINLIMATENMAKNSEIASTSSNTVMNTSVVSNTSNETVSAPQSTNELNRQTVLSLVGDKMDKTVLAVLETNSYQSSNKTPAYSQMIDEKIISCEWVVKIWKNCVAGPKGTAFTKPKSAFLLNIGKISPTDVSGISKINDTSAFADVVLSFEGNNNYDLYNSHSSAFDDVVIYESNNYELSNRYSWSYFKPNQVQRIMLRLYDDGWRIEKGR